MIRLANIEDIPRIVELGAMFHCSTVIKDIIPYDPDSMAAMVGGMLFDPARVVMVMELNGLIVGGIGGFIEPIYFNHSFMSAQQLFWFVAPEYRSLKSLRLLDAFCEWGTDNGARIVWTAAKLGKKFSGMNRMLKRKRFSMLDATYFKEV